jgi:hypothetical protein
MSSRPLRQYLSPVTNAMPNYTTNATYSNPPLGFEIKPPPIPLTRTTVTTSKVLHLIAFVYRLTGHTNFPTPPPHPCVPIPHIPESLSLYNQYDIFPPPISKLLC